MTGTDVPATIAIRPLPDTAFYQRMAAGHAVRTGHELDAVLADDGDGIWRVQHACCPADVPISAQDIEDFTAGGCSLLAEAIHEITGWELACFWDGFRPCGHAFVRTPDGRYLDITGVHTHREMLDSRWGQPGKRHGRRGITTAHYASLAVIGGRQGTAGRARQIAPAVIALYATT